MITEKNENINELISTLIIELRNLKIKDSDMLSPSIPHVILEDDIEVDASPGTPIKIDSRTYYRMIYADVNNLKRDTESLLNLYLDDVKPTLKSVDDNVKILTQNFKTVEADIVQLKTNKPKTFKLWLEEKSKFAENFGSLGKFIVWIIVIVWIFSTALPNIIAIITKASGIQ